MINLPADWKVDRLKDVSMINGVSVPATTDPDYEFDYLEISNVNYCGVIDQDAIEHLRYEDAPSRARRRVGRNNTIISSVRPNLQAVAFMPDDRNDLVCSTGFNVVQTYEQKLIPKFAYYMLISESGRQYFEASAKGVGYPAVDDKDFKSLPIPLPTLTEQKQIVAFLDASCAVIDAAVAAKQQQIETLDHVKSDIVQRAVTRGLADSPKLRATGNVWMKKVPAHWDLVSLKRVSEIHGGLTLGKVYEGTLIERPYLRVANVQDGHLNLDEVTTIEVPLEIAHRVELLPGDVLMTEGGDLDKLGRGTIWSGEIPDCLHQNHIFAIRCFKHKLLPHFLAHLTTSRFGRDYFEATGKRTTNLASTNSTKVGLFPIPRPPIAEQGVICNFLDEKFAELARIKTCIEGQIEVLTSYRKSLIHECVTGQRRITEADLSRVKVNG